MPFYLTDLVARPSGPPGGKVPRGFDQSSHWSILKLDAKVIGDRVLMWSADPISGAGIVQIADDASESIVLSVRVALANVRGDGRQIPDRFGDVLGELMMFPAGGRWNALRSMTDGVYRVKMGPHLIWSAPDPAGPRKASKQAQDNFNRADGNLDGSTSSDGQFTWTETSNTSLTVTSNMARSTNTDTNATAQASFVLDTDDMDVQMEVVTQTRISTASSVDAVARGTGVEGVGGGGYTGYLFDNNGTLLGGIYDKPNSISLAQASVAAVTGTLKFTVNGSSLEVFRNGSSITSVTDTQYTGVNKGGLGTYASGVSDVQEIDNFLIQDVGFVAGGAGGFGLLLAGERNHRVLT